MIDPKPLFRESGVPSALSKEKDAAFADTLTPDGMRFTLFAKAAYLACGSIALMSAHAVARNDLPTGFVRYLTAAEAWAAGLPVAEAVANHAT